MKYVVTDGIESNLVDKLVSQNHQVYVRLKIIWKVLNE